MTKEINSNFQIIRRCSSSAFSWRSRGLHIPQIHHLQRSPARSFLRCLSPKEIRDFNRADY